MFTEPRKDRVESESEKSEETNKAEPLHSDPAILTSGLIVDTVYQAPMEAYKYLTSEGAKWTAVINGEGLAFRFQQITLVQTIFGWQEGDADLGIESKLTEYVIRLNYFNPNVNKVAESNEGLHNHFRPLGALPIAMDGESNHEAYQMDWLRQHNGKVVEKGRMSVKCGDAYGIEDFLNVYHAVYTTREHISVAIGQIKPEPYIPATEGSLKPSPLKEIDPNESLRLKDMFVDVLGRYVSAQNRKIDGN